MSSTIHLDSNHQNAAADTRIDMNVSQTFPSMIARFAASATFTTVWGSAFLAMPTVNLPEVMIANAAKRLATLVQLVKSTQAGKALAGESVPQL